MSEVINVVVALAVIYFVFKWAAARQLESPDSVNVRTALGFTPKNITPEMVDTVATLFPHLPRDNIRYDLLRTGDVEITTNKVIERGFLDEPPRNYYRIYPRNATQTREGRLQNSSRTLPASSSTTTNGSSTTTATAITGLPTHPKNSLISRYRLETRLSEKINDSSAGTELLGWGATEEQRKRNLEERKAQMILAARNRLLAQQQQ